MYYFSSNKILILISTIKNLFQKYEQLTIKQISEILNNNYNMSEIYEAVDYLLVEQGVIIRDDYWSKDAIFKYVFNEYYQDSAFTRHYYSFTVDDTNNKKFLLISDTHIGNSELENYKMLHNVYKYALENGATNCFHMGDIFSGIIGKSWSEEDILKQFSLFSEFYPNFNGMKTYALIGNHDEFINGFFEKKAIPFEYDLRQLTKYASNFYIIPRKEWEIKLNNVMFHLSHRLYLNCFIRELKIKNLFEIEKSNILYNNKYDVLFSGHLHQGFIYNNACNGCETLLLGVPSTTNLNINGVVAYFIELNYDELNNVDSMDVTLLLCDSNNNISKGETINWSFSKNNKILKKSFNIPLEMKC